MIIDPAANSDRKQNNSAITDGTGHTIAITEGTGNTITAATNNTMISYRNSKVSRLVWEVVFEKRNAFFTDRCDIAVDLYTSEVICVESTK